MHISTETKQRYERFWNREATDRACLYLTAWDGSEPFPEPKDDRQRWLDLDYREAQTVYEITHTRYFAEGFPSVFVNFGPGSLTPCIGGSFRLSPFTIWFENEPFFIQNWETVPEIRLDEASEMYRLIDEMTRRFLRHKDLFVSSISDLGGTYDIIAALRGTENLLLDMYDHPEEVKAFAEKLEFVWREYFLRYSKKLLDEQGAMTTWQPLYSETSYYPVQCDYSAMLSPEMFREFILPDLAFQTGYMDRSIYHLDGPGEIPHVPALLSLPRLSAIQWTPGDGHAPPADKEWFPLIRRIQEGGKGVILLDPDADALPYLFENVSPRGLYILASVEDEKQAEEIIKAAARA